MPTPATTDTAGRGKSSLLNQAQLSSIAKTEQICRLALKPEFLSELVTPLESGAQPEPGDLTEAKIEALLAQCEQAREASGQAADATSDREEETDEQRNARTKLLAAIRFFQARARQKYHATKPSTLTDYGIGQDIDASRTVLEQYAKAIYDKTATDKLPKVTPEKRAELKEALQKYQGSKTSQASAQGTAGRLRADRNTMVKEIIAGRMEIQFAADAEWPFSDPANHPIRMQFQLPASRPFAG